MSGVNVEGGKGGRKSLDSEINMIPMIDLLMCMISFLLITAVWSTMSRINADAQVPSNNPDRPIEDKEPEPTLHVSILNDSEDFSLAWKKGGAVVSEVKVPKHPVMVGDGKNQQVRYPELATKIKSEWEANGAHKAGSDKRVDQAVLHCDNKTPYKEVVAVIDSIYAPQREFPGGGTGKLYPAMNVTFSMNAN